MLRELIMLTRSFTNCKYFNKSLELRLYLLLYVGCSRRITEYRWKEKEKQRRVLSVWSKYTENNLISSAVILIWTELSTGKKTNILFTHHNLNFININFMDNSNNNNTLSLRQRQWDFYGRLFSSILHHHPLYWAIDGLQDFLCCYTKNI